MTRARSSTCAPTNPGGGVKGGQVLGESDETATAPKHEGFSPDDVAATFIATIFIPLFFKWLEHGKRDMPGHQPGVHAEEH